jgi:hypothetical protein
MPAPTKITIRMAVLLVLSVLWSAAIAQAPSPATAEIAQLFSALRKSGCQFSRNGSWYNAEEASRHLQRKYDYLLKRGLATSAESFIDLAASESSTTGKPYLVRCGSAQPVPSKSWFTGQLQELRRRPGGAS